VELVRLRSRVTTIEGDLARAKAVLESEREKLQQRYDTAEARWLNEVDRARQVAKDQAVELKRLGAENRGARDERDRLQRELAKLQGQLAQALTRVPRAAGRRKGNAAKRSSYKRNTRGKSRSSGRTR